MDGGDRWHVGESQPGKSIQRSGGLRTVCDLNRDRAFLRRSARPRYEEYRPVVRIVDLFCGCGGLSLGIAEAARRVGLGTKVSMAIDSDEDAVAVYRSNFPRADVRCAPVETVFDGHLSAKQTKSEEAAHDKVGPVDVLIGGPPCQGSSDLIITHGAMIPATRFTLESPGLRGS